MLLILVLGGAFVVPWFIDWNAYKPRMEQMAEAALGVEVAIDGDMDFVLLPQPRMHFEHVRIGPEAAPIGAADLIEADLSLIDFLRDRFTVTELRLFAPQLSLTIDETGAMRTPITLAETASVSNVSIANARFESGTVSLVDLRSGERWESRDFTGRMQMTALRGPFVLQGTLTHGQTVHAVAFATSAMNEAGAMQLSATLRPVGGPFSAAIEGLLRTGDAPHFSGNLTYRQFAEDGGETVVGDLLLQGPVTADLDAVTLSEFTLLPDENQPTTRLTGSAALSLGADPGFEATVSGGVVTLLPGEVIPDDSLQPYAALRLLGEMPEPLIPALRAQLAISINELRVRGVSMRDVRLDARSDGVAWEIEEFSGRLSGDTTLKLTGTLARAAGWPAFEGTLALASPRLDALSLLWKRPQDGNPLFGMAGSLNGRVQLVNDRLSLVDGVATLDGTTHAVSGDVRFGATPSLDLDVGLSALTEGQSAALAALMPQIDPAGAFGLSFPQGRLSLAVEHAFALGLPLEGLDLVSAWSEAGMAFEQVALQSFGGVGFDGQAQASGSLAAPVVSGEGVLTIAQGARALDLVPGIGAAGTPLRRAVLGSLPARLDVDLEAPGRDTIQSAVLQGMAGALDLALTLDMTGGVLGLGREALGVTLDLAADRGSELFEQMGLPEVMLAEDGIITNARVFGNPRGLMEADLSIEGGGERIDFSGNLDFSNPVSLRGQGETAFIFQDGAALGLLSGARGVWFPALEGGARVSFIGGESVQFDAISALSGERALSGQITYAAQRDSALVTGALAAEALDIETLASMLAGPAALIDGGNGLWPDGPVDIGASPRQTRGRVSITAPALYADDQRLIEALAFDYVWGNEDNGLRGLFGEMGGGTVQLDATLCCSSTVASKSLSGRFTLNGVRLDAVLPEVAGDVLGGTLTLGAQFQASGESFDGLAATLNGEGSFSIADLRIEGLSPSVFNAAADVDDLVAIAPDDFEALVAMALASGPFRADEAGGLASMIGGRLRVSNLAIGGTGARLVGGGSLDLRDGDLDAQWTLGLTRMLAGNGLITETTGRLGVGVSGSIFDPVRSLDIGPMVDAIQMQAYELELNELEALRAEQEARQQAAAEEQARLMEEQARRAAEQLLLEQQQNSLQSDETRQLLDDIEALLNGGLDAPATNPAPAPTPQSPSFTILPPGALQLDGL
ncbi:AsmA family protein [Pelagibacterium lacus]|uniref:AsmA family protein n=2 Tax=Pelagibacterium lacus TaxID=2282655 RepID=A0A369W8M6_9HYPH|nr:AsmA family protein [Pelagibacterium lacus]